VDKGWMDFPELGCVERIRIKKSGKIRVERIRIKKSGKIRVERIRIKKSGKIRTQPLCGEHSP
jgi:hypothetical protein